MPNAKRQPVRLIGRNPWRWGLSVAAVLLVVLAACQPLTEPPPQNLPATTDTAGTVHVASIAPHARSTDDAFLRLWERTDGPVASGDARRTWLWGPEPFISSTSE